MAYTIKQARPILLGYLGLTEVNADYIPNTDNWGVRFTKDDLDCVIFMMPLGENTSSPKVYFDVRDSGAEKFVAAWEYAETHNLKFFCLGVKDVNVTYKDSIISIEADIKTVLKVSGLENGRRSGSGTQLNIPKTLIPNGNITRKKSEKFDIFYAVINKTFIFNYLETFDNRLFQFIAEPFNVSNDYELAENINLPRNRIVFGAPGTGKSHQLEEDCKTNFCDSVTTVEAHFIDEIKNKPQDEKNENVWFRHIGIKYASFIYNQIKENDNELLQERWSIEKELLKKLKNTAKAIVDYGHIISNSAEEIGKRYERVTFHPNYSFAQFVGTYKPVQNSEKGKESEILYQYVPGPFMRILVKALQHPEQNFLLIIEEINRANVAAVFGDVFQLLDRKNGVSEYPIDASEDVKKYLKDNEIEDCEELRIPNNMYIWATMNSADQGVFPMDTAFKRRWEFEYIGIDENEDGIKDYDIPLQKNADGSHEWVKWNDLRHSINNKLTEMKINEDKLLGPYFISEEKLKLVEGKKEENAAEFVKSFKSKVLMYLFEDAVKMRPGDLFDENAIGRLRFSDICQKFDEIGQGIFNFKK